MSRLRFNTYYSTVIDVGRHSGLPLPWTTEVSVCKRVLYGSSQFVIGLFLICKIACALDGITHTDKFEDVIFGTATLMFTLTGTLLTIFYTMRGTAFKVLTDNIDRVTSLIEESRFQQGFFKDLYDRDSRILSFFTKFMTTSTIVSPVFFVFSVPTAGLIQGNYGERMALPTHCRFELQTHSLYEVFVFFEFWGLVFPAIQKLANEFIMLGMFKIQAAYFKFLSRALNEISHENLKETREILLSWIKIHQAVIANAHDLITYFAPVVVLYYVSIICIVAGGVFYQLNASDANVVQSYFLGLYMVITVIHLYIQCHMADELTSAAENLAEAVYSIPWYVFDTRSKGFIKFIISMANRPIRIVAYKSPAFTLNKETFVAFMTNTVSSYMGFSKIMDMSE